MKITAQQLPTQLDKQLQHFYIISGAEPLLLDEAAAAIRLKAKGQGYLDREFYQVDTGFDWQKLLMSFRHQSLFSQQAMIELRMMHDKFTESAKKVLQTIATALPDDKIILLICPKLDDKIVLAKWFAPIKAHTLIVQVWPVPRHALPQWAKQRCAQAGIHLSPDALQLLVDHSEGNLLALKQEIDKLGLLYPKQTITRTELLQVMVDNTRYSVFECADCCLQGDAKRLIRILNSLRAEGAEPILVLWALLRDIRLLIRFHAALAQRKAPDQVLRALGVWERRKSLVIAASKRLDSAILRNLLVHASHIDRAIKGAEKNNSWDALQQLALGMAGCYRGFYQAITANYNNINHFNH